MTEKSNRIQHCDPAATEMQLDPRHSGDFCSGQHLFQMKTTPSTNDWRPFVKPSFRNRQSCFRLVFMTSTLFPLYPTYPDVKLTREIWGSIFLCGEEKQPMCFGSMSSGKLGRSQILNHQKSGSETCQAKIKFLAEVLESLLQAKITAVEFSISPTTELTKGQKRRKSLPAPIL